MACWILRIKENLSVTEWGFKYFHKGPGKSNDNVFFWLSKLENTSSSKSCRLLADLVRRILKLEESERPKAREVTSSLGLIALFEIAEGLNMQFEKIVLASKSLDAVIEHKRFESWKNGFGVIYRAGSDHPFPWSQAMDFELNSQLLFNMREVLESISSQQEHQQLTGHGSLSQLYHLNDRLYDGLDRRLQEQYNLYFRAIMIENDNEDFVKLLGRTYGNVSLDKELRIRASLKIATQLAYSASDVGVFKMQIDPNRIHNRVSFGDHQLGWLKMDTGERRVLVASRRYDIFVNEEILREVLVRVDAISELLGCEKPEEFHALDSCGFFVHSSRPELGIICNLPSSGSDHAIIPRTLRDVINDTMSKSHRHWPILDDRFNLALTLARSLQEFHIVGWLHKTLTSSNIAFFPAENQTLKVNFLKKF